MIGIVKEPSTFHDGSAIKIKYIESLIGRNFVDFHPHATEVSAGEYQLERIENPWMNKNIVHYSGDWLVLKGTLTGLPEKNWRNSRSLEIID